MTQLTQYAGHAAAAACIFLAVGFLGRAFWEDRKGGGR